MEEVDSAFEAAGKQYKYSFPNPLVIRKVTKLGFGGNIQEKWEKFIQDDVFAEQFTANWPEFIHTIIDGDSSGIDDLSKITWAEAQGIHQGFTALAWAVRKNSMPGLTSSDNSSLKTIALPN